MTLQLLSFVRGGRSVRVLADRCGQSVLRLWSLGITVNASGSNNERLVELPGGRVLAFDVVDRPGGASLTVVLSDSAGPKLVLS